MRSFDEIECSLTSALDQASRRFRRILIIGYRAVRLISTYIVWLLLENFLSWTYHEHRRLVVSRFSSLSGCLTHLGVPARRMIRRVFFYLRWRQRIGRKPPPLCNFFEHLVSPDSAGSRKKTNRALRPPGVLVLRDGAARHRQCLCLFISGQLVRLGKQHVNGLSTTTKPLQHLQI